MDIATLAGQLGIQLTAEAVTTIVNRLDKKEKKDKKKNLLSYYKEKFFSKK